MKPLTENEMAKGYGPEVPEIASPSPREVMDEEVNQLAGAIVRRLTRDVPLEFGVTLFDDPAEQDLLRAVISDQVARWFKGDDEVNAEYRKKAGLDKG